MEASSINGGSGSDFKRGIPGGGPPSLNGITRFYCFILIEAPIRGEHRRPPFWCWPFFALAVAPRRQHDRGKLAGRCSLALVLAMFLASSRPVALES